MTLTAFIERFIMARTTLFVVVHIAGQPKGATQLAEQLLAAINPQFAGKISLELAPLQATPMAMTLRTECDAAAADDLADSLTRALLPFRGTTMGSNQIVGETIGFGAPDRWRWSDALPADLASYASFGEARLRQFAGGDNPVGRHACAKLEAINQLKRVSLMGYAGLLRANLQQDPHFPASPSVEDSLAENLTVEA